MGHPEKLIKIQRRKNSCTHCGRTNFSFCGKCGKNVCGNCIKHHYKRHTERKEHKRSRKFGKVTIPRMI